MSGFFHPLLLLSPTVTYHFQFQFRPTSNTNTALSDGALAHHRSRSKPIINFSLIQHQSRAAVEDDHNRRQCGQRHNCWQRESNFLRNKPPPGEARKKMDGGNQLSIDLNYLETRLTEQLQRFQSLSRHCCVYRAPPGIRNSDERLFTPKIVSIGPIHYGKHQGLQAMEDHKRRYLKDFLGRTKKSMSDLVIFIGEKERQLRDCYSETIQLESHDFVEMILVDAAFIIELLLKVANESNVVEVDRILTKPWMIDDIWPDLFLLENQLPMFILRDLFEVAKTAIDPDNSHKLSMPNLIHGAGWLGFLLIEEELIKNHFAEAEHFVDLTRRCLEPPKLQVTPFSTLTTPSVTELHRAGVKFALGSGKHLLDIRFKNGILEIPKLYMVDETEGILRNVQVFERLHGESNHVNDYIIIMNHLVNTPKDVDLLVKNGVLENWLWNGEAVSSIFHNHLIGGKINARKFYYSGLVKDLNIYRNSLWNRWKANLKQNYFNTPWASISVIAASILLILTFLQTLYSMKK